MEDISIVIAGAAGEGVQTVGALLAKTLLTQGYAIFAWQEFESRIRGGQNSYSLRIGESPVNSPLMEADILLALNEGAAEKYRDRLKPDGIMIAPLYRNETGKSMDARFRKSVTDRPLAELAPPGPEKIRSALKGYIPG